MALSKAVKDSRLPPQRIAWYLDPDKKKKADLTGATITAKIKALDDTTVRNADGTFALVGGSTYEFYWNYGSLDVGTKGKFEVQFTATFAAYPGQAQLTFIEEWEVTDAL